MMKINLNSLAVKRKTWILCLSAFSAFASDPLIKVDLSSSAAQFHPYLKNKSETASLSLSMANTPIAITYTSYSNSKYQKYLLPIYPSIILDALNSKGEIKIVINQDSSYFSNEAPKAINLEMIVIASASDDALSITPIIDQKSYIFDKTSSKISIYGHYEYPNKSYVKYGYNLPHYLISSLEESLVEKRKSFLSIPNQGLSNPIPREEFISKNKEESPFSLDAKILQNFDLIEINLTFVQSSYHLERSSRSNYVIPQYYAFGSGSSQSKINLFDNDHCKAIYPCNLDSLYNLNTFIPLHESSFYKYILSFENIKLSTENPNYPQIITSNFTLNTLLSSFCETNEEKFSLYTLNRSKNDLFVQSLLSISPNIFVKEEINQKNLSPIKDNPKNFLLANKGSNFLAHEILEAPKSSAIFSIHKGDISYGFNKGSFVNHEKLFFSLKFGGFAQENLNNFIVASHQIQPSYDSLLVSQVVTQETFEPAVLQDNFLYLNPSHFINSSFSLINLAQVKNYYSCSYTKVNDLAEKLFFHDKTFSSVTPAGLEKTVASFSTTSHLDDLFKDYNDYSYEQIPNELESQCLASCEMIGELNAISPAELSFKKVVAQAAPKLLNPLFSQNEKFNLEQNFSYLEINPSAIEMLKTAHAVRWDAVDNQTLLCSQEHSSFLKEEKRMKTHLLSYSITTDFPMMTSWGGSIDSSFEENQIPFIAATEELFHNYKDSLAIDRSLRKNSVTMEEFDQDFYQGNYCATDDFIVDLQISPNTKEGGYLFSATLHPQQKKLETHCPQNYLFLIDRSGSIDKNKFQSFKQGVSKALTYLGENDTFNIITFDTEISKMSHSSVFATSSTKHGAKRYLENQKRGYQYGVPNISQLLLSLQPLIKSSELPTTIVLLTSGKTLDNYDQEVDEPLLKKQLKANKNSFTLFTAGCSDVISSSMIEMLSHLNRGEYIASQTNAAFPRKLAAMVKHATYLAASNVTISTAKKNPDCTIDFYPNFPIAPNLYGDKPYTIVGKINKLSDFDLVLQGKFCENYIFIKKRVSFSSARHAGHSIHKDLKTYSAYHHFHDFYQDGNIANLEKAQNLLKPLKKTF